MKKTIRDIELKGKRVLIRCDFNVPLDSNQKITDDTRIRAALPTLEYMVLRLLLCHTSVDLREKLLLNSALLL